jgi:hypothetical protein
LLGDDIKVAINIRIIILNTVLRLDFFLENKVLETEFVSVIGKESFLFSRDLTSGLLSISSDRN